MRSVSTPLRALALATCSAAFFSGAALAKDCDLSIEANDQMQYNTKELTVAKDCTNVKVTLKHTGKLPKASMGHNWVLTSEKDMQAVQTAGISAGLAADYIPKDAKIVAHTKLIGGGESDSTTFKMADLKKGETYKFFCSFPGHSALMNGTLVVK